MKKLLFALFIAAVMFTGCQKDSSTKVTITGGDLAAINGQLKGTWVFPVQTLSFVDSTGKALRPSQNMASPALQFDGGSKVNIMPDEKTVLKGTYKLSTDKGSIYVDIIYPDQTTLHYLVTYVNSQALKLNMTQPYVYYKGNSPIAAEAIITTELKKQSSADVTANTVRVTVQSDSLFNVGVSVTHPGVATILLNSQTKIAGPYSYSFLSKPGDQLKIDVFCSIPKTAVNAYYNGLPLPRNYNSGYGEIVTTGDWVIH